MVMPGHEDLQPRRVAFTSDGHAVVGEGEGRMVYEVYMMPNGSFVGRPVQPVPIDQLAQRSFTRWQGVDQL